MSQTPFTASLLNVLSGGTYPNRWIPQEVRLKPDTTETRTADHARTGDLSSGGDPSSVVSGFSQTVTSAFSAVSAVSSSSVDIKPMIPLGQFRDTFIIAVDDEGIAIIASRSNCCSRWSWS
jgi:hypothetical protein